MKEYQTELDFLPPISAKEKKNPGGPKSV